MKFYNYTIYLQFIIEIFILLSQNAKSIKLKNEISRNRQREDKLIKDYLNNIKDIRQKNQFQNKLRLTNNYQRKAFAEDLFFENYIDQMNNYSVYSKKTKEYENFRYFTYTEITEKLKLLQSKYDENIKVTTSQELFKLPNPIGDCGNKPCENFIVYLGNKKTFTNETPQMFISCALHGDEKVGPTLCVELIELMLENYDNSKWVKFLLHNRMIILTPMTNAYGYYMGMRVYLYLLLCEFNFIYRKR
jgi:hypothetical protein